MPEQSREARAEVVCHVKITKPDGRVFHADIPAIEVELYRLPDGTLSPVYPANAVIGDREE